MTRWQFFQTILASFLPWKKLAPAPIAPPQFAPLSEQGCWYGLDTSHDYFCVRHPGFHHTIDELTIPKEP